jgi:hypothetical protein
MLLRSAARTRLELRHPFRVPFLQVLMADALASGQKRISELRRLEVGVTRHVLEPLGAVPRRALEPQHFDPTVLLIGVEGVLEIGVPLDSIGELNGIVERELGARPMEKCAVWAESPRRTTFPSCHFWLLTRGKLSQAEPLRWAALSMSSCRRESARKFLRNQFDSSLVMRSKPSPARFGRWSPR